MSNDTHVKKYLEPIISSRKTHSMMFASKYKISIPNPAGDGQIEEDVINIDDVNDIVITAQIEATVTFIETLLKDDNLVMIDHLRDEFSGYVNKMRNILNDTRNERT